MQSCPFVLRRREAASKDAPVRTAGRAICHVGVDRAAIHGFDGVYNGSVLRGFASLRASGRGLWIAQPFGNNTVSRCLRCVNRLARRRGRRGIATSSGSPFAGMTESGHEARQRHRRGRGRIRRNRQSAHKPHLVHRQQNCHPPQKMILLHFSRTGWKSRWLYKIPHSGERRPWACVLSKRMKFG